MHRSIKLAAIAVAIGVTAPARSQGIPVIDVAAIAQLIQQIAYWEEQITAMANQLNQLRETYSAMTGSRGMEGILPTTTQQRNYLPSNYAELMGVVNGSSTSYAGLSSQVQAVLQANAVLSNAQMQSLSPETRRVIEQGRKSAAMVATLSQAAYQNTSQRFAALQQLIQTIGATTDQKAIEELQARVNSEQAMLANEQAKLQSLSEIAKSEDLALKQRVREQVISSHGSFSSRFTPSN
jgi:type IV secretion system protein VirB5